MPLYTFMNKDTDEVFTEMMSISQREEYLSQNPNITQQIVKVNMVFKKKSFLFVKFIFLLFYFQGCGNVDF